jgi:hypothetical protein
LLNLSDLLSEVGALATMAAIVPALFELLGRQLERRRTKGRQETTEMRIRKLTTSLTGAVDLINGIEREIEGRQALVGKLQKDVKRYTKLAALKKDEVEAVAQSLRGEIQREERRSFWRHVALNAFFFILGILASYFLLRPP